VYVVVMAEMVGFEDAKMMLLLLEGFHSAEQQQCLRLLLLLLEGLRSAEEHQQRLLLL
jgi:hypothetical protein